MLSVKPFIYQIINYMQATSKQIFSFDVLECIGFLNLINSFFRSFLNPRFSSLKSKGLSKNKKNESFSNY